MYLSSIEPARRKYSANAELVEGEYTSSIKSWKAIEPIKALGSISTHKVFMVREKDEGYRE